MSWDWNDKDLLDWTKKTLPEFLLIAFNDPEDSKKVIARTPWECFEVSCVEVEIDGDVTLTGKKNQGFFLFDIDLGMRLNIEKKIAYGGKTGADQSSFWSGIVQISHFENNTMQPPIMTKLEGLENYVSDEVGWYLRDGMGRRYIWHALARWHAYAVKKWMKDEQPPAIENPYMHPEPAPAFPPFREAERKRREEDRKQELDAKSKSPLIGDCGPISIADLKNGEALAAKGLSRELKKNAELEEKGSAPKAMKAPPRIGKKLTEEEAFTYESPPTSDDEDDYDQGVEWEMDEDTMEMKQKPAPPKLKKFGRYPFLPSMLAGVAGPATEWLRPKEHAIAHPEWFRGIKTKEPGKITALDRILHDARKKREEYEKVAGGRHTSMMAIELCEAIERGDVMKMFAKMDEKTTNCPHPNSGRWAAHYCVEKGSKEMLQMIVEAKACVNCKDSYGQTPLMMAARQMDNEMTKVLLDAGADATEEDALGRVAGDMVKVKPGEVEHPLNNWRGKMSGEVTPESQAKKTQEMKKMIDDKERPKKYGAMLVDAIAQKDARTAESSLEAGGDANFVDGKGDTPLLLIAKGKWKNQEGLQQRLAEKAHKAGAKVDFQNPGGNTALHYAAHRGHALIAETLLRLRADPTLVNSEGNTALMYAAHGGHEAICTQLLEAFSSPSVKNNFGLSAEQMAQQRGHRSCAVLIQAYEMAPKQQGDKPEPKKKSQKGDKAFDYSKWNALEKEMQEDEEIEAAIRTREANAASRGPQPAMEDMGPADFGLPPGTPWPPPNPQDSKKGPFDYSRWDKIVDDVERHQKVEERYEYLQANPQYEYRNGQKMRVIF